MLALIDALHTRWCHVSWLWEVLLWTNSCNVAKKKKFTSGCLLSSKPAWILTCQNESGQNGLQPDFVQFHFDEILIKLYHCQTSFTSIHHSGLWDYIQQFWRNSCNPSTCNGLAVKTSQNADTECPSWSPCRPVLRWRSILSGAAPGLHMSLLWQDGLHRDLPAGARGCRAHRDLHRSGKFGAEVLHTVINETLSRCLHGPGNMNICVDFSSCASEFVLSLSYSRFL